MAKRANIPNIQEIRDIYYDAKTGNADALEKLGEINNKLSKRANQRIRSFEDRGIENESYKRAKYYTGLQGREYFSQSRKMNADDLIDNIEEVTTFLREPTSTVTNYKKAEKIVDELIDRDVVMFTDETSREDYRKAFIDFLNTDAWDDIRAHNQGGTNVLITEASDAIMNGAKLGDLVRAFKDYKNNTSDTDRIEMWANWTGGQKYYRSGEWHDLKTPRF